MRLTSLNQPLSTKTTDDAFAKTFTVFAPDLHTLPQRSNQVQQHGIVRIMLGAPSSTLRRERPQREHVLHAEPFAAGSLIGFSGSAWSSAAICLATYGVPFWSLSHVAIVGTYNGRLVLFESTTDDLPPCEVTGHKIRGVQAHEPQARIASYHGKVWHYSLSRELYSHEQTRLTRFLLEQIGKSYDQLGAFRAGGLGFSFVESLLHEEALHSFFCSELVAAAHDRIGLFPTGNAGRWSPNHLVRSERRRGLLKPPKRLK